MVIEAKFTFERETKGAIRYQEIDAKGAIIEQPWCKVGALYLRKSAFDRGAKFPRKLSVSIECEGEIDGPVIA